MLAVNHRRVLPVATAVIAVILLISYYFLFHRTLERQDHALLDAFFRIRGATAPSKDILLVGLDSESAVRMQRKAGQWTRSDFASAIDVLTAAGADLIAIDYIFSKPGADPAQDEALRAAMEQSANVILASIAAEDARAHPLDLFREQEVGEGLIDTVVDSDGLVRRTPSFFAKAGAQGDLELELPLSVEIALSRLYPSGDFKVDLSRPDRAILGDLVIPYSSASARHGFFINYAGPAGHFPMIPLSRVLNRDFAGHDLHGKIILIGNMNPLEHDYYPVPLQPAIEKGKTRMPSMYGVEIHANALHTLLTRRFLAPVSLRTMAVLLTLISLAAIWCALGWKTNAFAASGTALLILIAFAYASYRLFLGGWFVPGSPVLLSGTLIALTGLAARQAQESAEKRYITQLFGRYVSPGVVKELIRHKDLVKLQGRKERLTMFFSDVRGFTTMSEKMKPEDVSAMLNEYFSRMTRIVFKHGGTLDKFMGDAIMCFFGNPIFFPDHPKRAVEMALEMKEEMQKLKQEWKDKGRESSFDVGMGINTGEVVVGNLGSEEFFDYTVIGDDVNLACRLESNAKRGQIIISEIVYQEVKDFFEILKLDPITVKGKAKPVQIYEVLSARVNPEGSLVKTQEQERGDTEAGR